MNGLKIIRIIFFTMAYYSLFAQNYHAQTLSLEDGLSQSIVYDIAQDDKGFMWFATQDGLNRYDGYSFSVFKNEPFDTTSLNTSQINCLLVDNSGNLWVGAAGGLHRYMPAQDRFERIVGTEHAVASLSNNNITVLHEGKSGLWVGTAQGFNLMTVDENGQYRFTRFQYRQEKTINCSGNLVPLESGKTIITALYEDSRGDLWVGTKRGLFVYNFSKNGDEEETVRYFESDQENVNALANENISSICEDIEGSIWVGTYFGLHRYRPETADFERFFTKKDSTYRHSIAQIILAENGALVVASKFGNLQILPYNKAAGYSENFIQLKIEDKNDKALSNRVLYTVFEDRIKSNNLWVGTMLGGVCKLIKNQKQFQTNHLNTGIFKDVTSPSMGVILKDSKGYVWLNTETGLIRYDREKEKLLFLNQHTETKYKGKGKYALAIHEDKQHNLWIGSGHGLEQMWRDKQGIFRFKDYSDQLICEPELVRCIYESEDGLIYFGGKTGINIYNPANDKILSEYIVLDTVQAWQRNYKIASILKDRQQRLWVGTHIGLILVRDVRNPFTDISAERANVFCHKDSDPASIRDHAISCVLEGRDGTIWVGTSNGFSKVLDQNGAISFEAFSEKDGLVNNMVYGILEDKATGHLWISSNGGLSDFDPITETFDNYNINDGLQSSEFNGGSFFAADDGELFFGGINGLTSFYPDQIRKDTIPPKVWITDYTSTDQQQSLLHKFDKSLQLSHYQNTIMLNFIALNYTNPQENRYAYRLEGLHDTSWTMCGANRQVQLSALPHGNYIFKVKAANSDGVWNELGDQLHIMIRPPFWKTPWFYALLALLIGGFLWGLHRYRLRLELNKVLEIERVRKNAAADFHDELGHKLTIISLFTEIIKNKLLKGQQNGALMPHLDKVIDTSGSLYHSMKDLLWALDPEKDSVYDLVIMLKDFGDELFDKTEVAFQSEGIYPELNKRNLPMEFKRHIVLIFKEAMNNSLKHAACKNALLKIEYNGNGRLAIAFQDDGTGFDIEKCQTGNGLENIKGRAIKINGELAIESNDKGTFVGLVCDLEGKVES